LLPTHYCPPDTLQRQQDAACILKMDGAHLNPFSLSSLTGDMGSGMSMLPEGSPTANLSNTVSISEPGDWLNLDEKTVEELSEFGDVARLDISLGTVLRCVLVTFFDVRCAQRLILHFGARAESFPPAAHDTRIVSVNMQAFTSKALMGGFQQFGEVANISMYRGDAIVEFYDMRSAQFLLAAAGGGAQPWSPDQSSTSAMGLEAFMGSLTAGLGANVGAGHGLGAMVTGTPPGQSPLAPGLLSKTAQRGAQAQAASPVPSSPASTAAPMPRRSSNLSFSNLSDVTEQQGDDIAKAPSNRPVRTKVTTKDFSKYDIDPEKIQIGEDRRTTVMVRNLTGPRARKDFLQFLERCGLAERYTFFYMPCKEHRNVPAGFAFLNLVSASDVHKLFVMVKSGFWREFLSDPQSKAPAMSYARFQGHEELSKHFSSSAVLHEQDPEKRPIFRPDAGKHAAQEPSFNGYPSEKASKAHDGATAEVLQGEAALHMALSKGANEIAAILMRKSAEVSAGAPAAPPGIGAASGSSGAPAYISIGKESASKGFGSPSRLQGIQEGNNMAPILNSEQMGA
jgi:hypothetical protein